MAASIKAWLSDLSKETGAFCQLYIEEKTEHVISYTLSVDDMQVVRSCGAGLKLIAGSTSAYTYTSDTTEEGLHRLILSAKELLPETAEKEFSSVCAQKAAVCAEPNSVRIDPKDASFIDRVSILQRSRDEIDKAGFTGSFRFQFIDVDQNVTVITSDAEAVKDRRINSCVRLYYNMEIQGKMVSAWTQYVRPCGIEAFESEDYASYFVRHLKKITERNEAVELERGAMPVVFAPSAGGTFWHECCGHQLEARAICHHVSDFEGKIGQKVASDKVTLIDDGTYDNAYGSSVYDDEGNPRRRNVLIEKGILKQYMCDEYYGRQLGYGSNGCGRRQNYTFEASSRMSNTFLMGGEDDPEAIIKEIPYGLYVKSLGGGSGGKVFSILCTEGYLIKDGKLDRPVKNCMLTARGMDVMMRVDRVGNDVIKEPSGGGFCGADSGLIPVTSFGPTFRLSEMEVG